MDKDIVKRASHRLERVLTLKLEYMRLNDAMPGNPGLKHKVYELNDAMTGNPGFKTGVYEIE